MKVFFRVNGAKKDAGALRRDLAAALPEAGLQEAESAEEADIVIALGGDGTILDAVRESPGKPVAGFNIGSLGYLASVERKDFKKALALLAKGKYRIAQRTMIECRSAKGGAAALNEIALVREHSGRAVTLDISIDGRRAARYLADGVIFATPTGSTAYSLSAGGPILMPDSASLAITPLNPHALAARPVVAGDDVEITVAAAAREDGLDGSIAVAADGLNVFTLSPGETMELRKSQRKAFLVEFEGYDPYEVLSRKLGWPGGGGKEREA